MSKAAKSILVFGIYLLRINPRMWLQDYPQDIQDRVPPKTEREKRQALIVGIPFLVVLAAVPFISTLTLNRQGGGDTPLSPALLERIRSRLRLQSR